MVNETIDEKDHITWHRLDMEDEWLNGAYDETGDTAVCDLCGAELRWESGVWVCPECGREMTREEYFNHIGANPPSAKCVKCNTNYPLCKQMCDLPEIRSDDPMLR